ncbi:MAG: 4Fe-4S binding protein [Acidobacteria bacterium]|nr:4Fe-4S binding protein [Acidobacteriota bacterium]
MATPDLSAAPAPPAVPPLPHYRRTRKRIHLLCFLIFLILPFFDVMRFDLPRQRFHFAGQELLINEFAIIFFTLMFLLFVVVGMSVVYGRIYCGYMCPQMIFSEATLEVENWIRKRVTKRWPKLPAPRRKLLSQAALYLLLAAASIVLAFVFISYFVEPRDLFVRLLHFDLQTAGGISGAVVTLITFLDFAFLRQRFCTTVCPYGYLQGMLVDNQTLLVSYRDEAHECIECQRCVRDCMMGIDIRKSPFQIECVHCGECIDSCAAILARLGKPGLIHYTWGEHGSIVAEESSWWRKLGIRDTKRVVVLLVTLFYLSGLTVALSMRKTVLIQLQPVRAQLYRLGDDGTIYNKFRLKLVNRGSTATQAAFAVQGIPGARLTLETNPIPLAAGETRELEFEIAAAPFPGASDVNHMQVTMQAGTEHEQFDQTFLMPPEGKRR